MDTYKNVTILQGAEGIKRAYREALDEGKLDIVCLSDKYDAVIGGFFAGEYAPILYGSDMVTREILPDNPENRQAAAKKSAGHQVRLMKLTKQSESDMIVAGGRVYLISFNPNDPHAIIIADKEIVSSLTMQFEALWQKIG